jgi:hypothetical protein
MKTYIEKCFEKRTLGKRKNTVRVDLKQLARKSG